MWAIDRRAASADFAFPGREEAGLIMIVIGLVVEAVCAAAFLRAKTTVSPLRPDKASALVTGGLYGMSRNPMYLGLVILLLGWGLRLGDGFALLIPPLFLWAITVLQIKPEERALSAKFGAAYEAYRARVRRWI